MFTLFLLESIINVCCGNQQLDTQNVFVRLVICTKLYEKGIARFQQARMISKNCQLFRVAKQVIRVRRKPLVILLDTPRDAEEFMKKM